MHARLIVTRDYNVQIAQLWMPSQRIEQWQHARRRIVPIEKDCRVVRDVELAVVHLEALAVHGAAVTGGHGAVELLV